MAEFESNDHLAQNHSQAIVDRLVFAALKEQTRARRWRIFFMLFFIIYISVVTIVLMGNRGDGFGAGQAPAGDKHTALVRLDGIIATGEAAGSEETKLLLQRLAARLNNT